MFEFINVTVSKDQRTILHNISVTLSESRIGIIGLNGSGKSTFGKLLNGLETPTAGVLRYQQSEAIRDRRHAVGFVFQNPDNQIVYPIVREDLAFGLHNLRLPAAEIQHRIDAVARRFALTPLLDRFVHTLSGGERQLVALAGVLVMQPNVIVFDEPTSLLDLKNKRRLMQAIDQLEQQVILITHDLDSLHAFTRVLQIEDGAIKRDGDPATVIAAYQEEYA